ncbi:MAG: hypothetical protein LC659_09570 [Myxococcales bacterium]|nr:hypothetical protein [Myxococcales bacterium]
MLTARLRAVRPSSAVPDAGVDEPSDDELLRYIDGSMSAGERDALEARLADEPAAAARVAIVAEALAEGGWGPAAKAEPVGRRAVNLASRFVFRLSDGVLSFLRGTDLPRGLEPAMALRSSAPAQPQSFFEFLSRYPFEAGHVDARLAVEPVAEQAVDVQIDVTQAGVPLEGVRVKLLRNGQPVDSAPTEKGRCTFSALSAARYELEIRKGGTEVGRMVLDIRGDGVA